MGTFFKIAFCIATPSNSKSFYTFIIVSIQEQ